MRQFRSSPLACLALAMASLAGDLSSARGAPADVANPLLDYIPDDAVAVVLLEPRSLIEDTEMAVMGDIAFLGEMPIPPSQIEHLALFVRLTPALEPELVIGLHFCQEFSTATLRHWLLPSFKQKDNPFGFAWYARDDSAEEPEPGMPIEIAAPAERVALAGFSYSALDHVLRQSRVGPADSTLATHLRQRADQFNLQAATDLGRLRSTASLISLFDPSLQQVAAAAPEGISVLALEAEFGRGVNQMQFRLAPTDDAAPPDVNGQVLASAVAAISAQPVQQIGRRLPAEADELLRSSYDNLLDLLRDLETVRSDNDLVLRVKRPPSLSRAVNGAVQDVLRIAVLTAREAARSMALANNMKQVMLAWHNFHDAHQHFPENLRDAAGQPLLSWRVAILPYLGEEELYKQFRLDEPWDSEHNRPLLTSIPAVYRDVWNEIDESSTRLQGVTGPGAALGERTTFASATDGASNTAVLVQASEPAPWTQPADVPLEQASAEALDFRARRSSLAYLDGHVSSVEKLAPETFRKLFVRNDREVISLEELEPSAEEPEERGIDPVAASEAPELIASLASSELGQVRDATAQLFFLRERLRFRHPLAEVLLAWHNYCDVHGRFPPNQAAEDGQALLSWRVLVLPFLGETELFEQFRLDEPWDSPHNKALIPKMPDAYQDHGGELPVGRTRFAAVTGPGTVFGEEVRISQISDGLSSTAAVVESRQGVIWTKPEDVPLGDKLGDSLHANAAGRIVLGMLDGQTLEFETLPNAVLRQLFRYQDGQPQPLPASRPAVQNDWNQQVRAAVIALLQSPQAERRLLATALFWHYADAGEAVDAQAVRGMLADPSRVVRQYAIHSLAQRETPQAAQLLLELEGAYESDADDAFLDRLATVAGDAVTALLTGPDAFQQRRALDILRYVGAPHHVPAVQQLLSDPELAASARTTINEIQDRAANPEPDEDSEARAEFDALRARRDRLWNEGQQLLQQGNRRDGYGKVLEMLELERKLFGESHQEVLDTLNWLANQYYGIGRFEDAKRFIQHRVAAIKKKRGPDHPDVRIAQLDVVILEQEMGLSESQRKAYQQGKELVSQAQQFAEQGKYEDAAKACHEADALYQQSIGPDGVSRILALRILRSVSIQLEQPQQALKYADEVERLAMKYLGASSPVTQSDKSEQAYISLLAGDKQRALAILTESLATDPAPQSRGLFADNARFLAVQLDAAGQPQRAQQYYRMALRLADASPQKLSTGELTAQLAAHCADDLAQEVAWRLSSVWRYQQENPFQGWWSNYPRLAELMHQTGQLHLELALRSALADGLRQGVQQKQVNIGFYAQALVALAGVYIDLGDFLQANQALAECAQIVGDYRDEPFVVDMLTHQASVAGHFGNVQREEELLQAAVQTSRQQKPEFEAVAPAARRRLAEFYAKHGDAQQARTLFDSARATADRAAPLDRLSLLASLARFELAEGNDEQARTIASEGAQLLAAADLGAADEVDQLAAYGQLLAALGDADQAEAAIKRGLQLAEQAFGDESLAASQLLSQLAALHASQGRLPQAQQAALQALQTTRQVVEHSAFLLSPRQQLAFSRSMRESLDLYLSLALQTDSARDAFQQTYLWKGAGLVRQRAVHRLAAKREAKPFYEAIADVTTQLASITRQEQPPASDAPQQQALQDLEEQLHRLTIVKDRLEAQLSAVRLAYLDLEDPPTVDAFLEKLPPDAAFIDYLVYERFAPAPGEAASRRLLATVVRSDGSFALHDLGAAAPLEDLVQSWRAALGAGDAGRAAGQALRERLMDPLAESLAGAATLLVSPDDFLGSLPLHALPARQGDRYLIEDYRMAVIPTPQLYAAAAAAPSEPPARGMLLVGDVAYDATAAEDQQQAAADTIAITTRALRAGQSFLPLPGTRDEIRAIEQLFAERNAADPDGAAPLVLSAAGATEAAFRDACARFANIHVATHGFFAPAANSSAAGLQAFNPGLLSGLALAGANDAAGGSADDGVLTAEEIAVLDMEQVDLAVLSACETGLGRVAGGEGLIGIQRAFQVAGADAVVASLWQVPDQATRVLMERFYDNYWNKHMSQLEALHEAQVFLLNNPAAIANPELARGDARRGRPPRNDPDQPRERLAPESWAAFIIAGRVP